MSTDDCIMALFIRVDERLGHLSTHPQANVQPSELVTLGLLFARNGVGPRAFCLVAAADPVHVQRWHGD